MEQNEIHDKLIDGVNAVRNAMLEGVLPGGGASLVHASKLLNFCVVANFEEEVGLKVLKKALCQPFINILTNAGFCAESHLENLVQSNNWRNGFDVKQGKIVDMFEFGVGLLDFGHF